MPEDREQVMILTDQFARFFCLGMGLMLLMGLLALRRRKDGRQ